MTTVGTGFARELRQRTTRAEAVLRKALRGGRLDGAVHDQDDNQLNDYVRQQEIETLGWFVLRFRNDQVTARLHTVLEAIRDHARLADSVTPHPSHRRRRRAPPSPSGRGIKKTT